MEEQLMEEQLMEEQLMEKQLMEKQLRAEASQELQEAVRLLEQTHPPPELSWRDQASMRFYGQPCVGLEAGAEQPSLVPDAFRGGVVSIGLAWDAWRTWSSVLALGDGS
ncbi:hypothetical protein EYF80_060053 [Liparis tanakae]|uniref:Uncharacterized protein n=1 Tax=Liparis tanakae TaxID=230148 RepID=A0A4Z2ELY8_9TELE|nr:hypothetical protein EYF80_060053 [Liparis tanakae]